MRLATMRTHLGVLLAVFIGAMFNGITYCNAQATRVVINGPPPGLLPLDPIGIYGSLQVRL